MIDPKRFWAALIAAFILIMLVAHSVGYWRQRSRKKQVAAYYAMLMDLDRDMKETIDAPELDVDEARDDLKRADRALREGRRKAQSLRGTPEGRTLEVRLDHTQNLRDALQALLELHEDEGQTVRPACDKERRWALWPVMARRG